MIVEQPELKFRSEPRDQAKWIVRSLKCSRIRNSPSGSLGVTPSASHRVIFEYQNRFEQRRAARPFAPPLPPHHWGIFILPSCELKCLDTFEPLNQRLTRSNANPDRDGVDKHPNHRFDSRQGG